MDYSVLAETYGKLEAVSSKLKKTDILAELLVKTPDEQLPKVALLAQGIVYPRFTGYELGIAVQMMIRAISKASGFSPSDIENKFKRTGDLGLVAEECIKSRRQAVLLKKKLTIDKVFKNLQDLAFITGAGSQEKKLSLIAELLVSAKPKEARYIARTVLGELRIGVAEGIIRDAIVKAFLFKENMDKEKKEELTAAVDYAWNLVSDFGEVAKVAKEKGINGLRKARVHLGKPTYVMLAIKSESLEKLIKKYGKIAIEKKYDGARIIIHKKGSDFWLFTRRLEDVTKQFPDLVELARRCLKPKDCIVEGEMLGINSRTGYPLPFQTLSQRIHRKYDIDKMVKEIPVQMNLFDVVYLEGKMLFDRSLKERRDVLEKIVKPVPEKFQLAEQLVTDDVKKAEKFYKKALKDRQEGVMVKVLGSPYIFGRHVEGWMKIKPVMESLDLVIVGATWGEGARAKWLTSYELACRDPDTGKLLRCGMMSTGLTEEGYKNMTERLKSLIVNEKGRKIKVKPKIVVEVKYQEIQKSPNYESGFALRFPAFEKIRFEKSPEDADDINRVRELFKSQGARG